MVGSIAPCLATSIARASRGETTLPELYVKTLQRAAEICGGEQELAFKLRVTPSHLALWLRGIEQPPGAIFLRAVDLVMEFEMKKLATRVQDENQPEADKPQGDDKPGDFKRS
jgi:hypothetical protein